MDYDGAGAAHVTSNKSINLSPMWSPDTRSLAFTSYMRGYPYLYRMFPFESRPVQVVAGFLGINSSPAFSPDGRFLAMTLSRDGNPEVYLLNLATGAFRRLTTYSGIDTEPTWSPTGREIAFVSERAGGAHVFVMDAEGANVRRLTQAGFNTQPRWSPKGDTIVFTSRQGNFDLWAVSPDGSNLRRLTAGPRQQRGRLLGAQRAAPRLPVEPVRRLPAVHHARGRVGAAADPPHPRRIDKCRLVATPSVIGCVGSARSR